MLQIDVSLGFMSIAGLQVLTLPLNERDLGAISTQQQLVSYFPRHNSSLPPKDPQENMPVNIRLWGPQTAWLENLYRSLEDKESLY